MVIDEGLGLIAVNIELRSVSGGALVASVEDDVVSISDANGERLRIPLSEVHYLADKTRDLRERCIG